MSPPVLFTPLLPRVLLAASLGLSFLFRWAALCNGGGGCLRAIGLEDVTCPSHFLAGKWQKPANRQAEGEEALFSQAAGATCPVQEARKLPPSFPFPSPSSLSYSRSLSPSVSHALPRARTHTHSCTNAQRSHTSGKTPPPQKEIRSRSPETETSALWRNKQIVAPYQRGEGTSAGDRLETPFAGGIL